MQCKVAASSCTNMMSCTLPLAVGDNLDAVLVPLDLCVVLLDAQLEDRRLVLHHLLALELAGELVGKLLDLHLALGLVGALLAKVLDDALVLARVAQLGGADVQGAHAVLRLHEEPQQQQP